MTEPTLVWEEPSRGRGRTSAPWTELLRPLVDHPERWARVYVFERPIQAYQAAANLKAGRVKAPPGRFEYAGRATDDGGGALFARYMGEQP